MKYPIGVQSFEEMRTDTWLYVDKTRYVHDLVSNGKYYFLSRPRRFGKSLLISTLEAYFLGRRELFKGLAIESLADDWEPRPVIHIDLNASKYTEEKDLNELIGLQLRHLEERYGLERKGLSVASRFAQLVKAAYAQTGRKMAILVDEYDKPLLATSENPELQDTYRKMLKGFYGVLKSCDADIQFAMLTGVTKFSKVSIFSDLNNLEDITFNDRYSTICGITPDELEANFKAGIDALAQKLHTDHEGAISILKKNYDGYHFSASLDDVYNPYSLISALKNSVIGDFWFDTGTPTFLADKIHDNAIDLTELEKEEVDANRIMSVDLISEDPVPVLFQSGYLTIKDYDSEFREYRLGYPNREVKEAFLKFILPEYTKVRAGKTVFSLTRFVADIRNGEPEAFMKRFSALFAGYPYELISDCELHYHNVIYLTLTLMGFYVRAEYHTSDGRCDAMVQTDRFIYIFEFKYDKSAREALEQIERKRYAAPFAADTRKIFRIGVNFSPETRSIDEYLIESTD